LEDLLSEYDITQKYITDIQDQKNQIELALMDLDSKDTLTKQYMKLQNESEGYKEICFRLSKYQSDLLIISKKLDMLKAVAHMFKDYDAFGRLAQNINQKGL
jgi:hypothetical protein